MCNFYGHKVDKMNFIRLNNIELELGYIAAIEELQELINGFNYGKAPVIRKKNESSYEVVPMHWQQARRQGIPWLNASSEKLLESKMFRDAALKRRCLVLASHFFEWRSFKPATKKKENKYPYCIELNNKEYFFMAGIWQPFTDKETGETMDTFAIVTTKANALMEQLHNHKKRMPVILTEKLAEKWLQNDLTEEQIKEIASFQLPANDMVAFTIAKNFKTSISPLEAFYFEELPELIK